MLKFFMILLGWIIAFVPTYAFLLAKYLMAPEGFWQNLILYGIGLYFLGGLQLLLVIVAVMATLFIISEV